MREAARRPIPHLVLALVALLLTQAAWGAAGDDERNHDARETYNLTFKASPGGDQKAAVEALRAEVPELLVTYDKARGTTRTMVNPTGYLTGPNPGVDPREVALDFIKANRKVLGLSGGDIRHYEVQDQVYSKATGATHVYLQQVHKGIGVYNGLLQVNVNRDGRVMGLANGFVADLARSTNAAGPALDAAGALARLAEHLGTPLSGTPTVVSDRPGERRRARLSHPGLSREEILAQLTWLPVRAGETRLAWNLQVQTLDDQHHYDATVDAVTGEVWTRFDWTTSGSYRVYPEPVESPNHTSPAPPADGRVLVVNPEDSTASPNGWFTGGTMSGNNVTACPDASPANNVCDSNPQCSGTTCDFPIDLTSAPSNSIPAATANLFYWNNLIHDVQYQYGFDEPAGNFQENNFGKGGAGSDSVNADAQDGSGNCNANFSTPTDGGNPRMQMFTCDNTNPARDGDYDNGVIVHEYGHGISIRQVGGPGNSSCLNNTQQAGEGWSDWFALVYTHEPGDQGTDSRGIGTYLFGQAANGPGIRDLPYSTDPAVNNWTYESISGASVPHGVGSRWAQGIWEVYWALVDKWGFEADLVNFDISDPNEAGNKRALFYVNEGLKNTACSPTFVDNRDGIIQAATDNFGGVDVCDMWTAFAAFGLGTDAVSGGSNSTNPTNGFSVPAACQCSPQPIADAGPDQTICLGDSVQIGTPAQPGHTYSWSPGGATTAQITVSPSVTTTYTVTATTSCGSAQDSVTVTVDDGSGGGLDDDFESGASGWTTSGLWHLTSNSSCASPGYSSPVNAFYYGQDATCNYDTGAANSGSLTSPSITGINATSTLTFDYYRVVESFSGDFDRTRVEIVPAGGSPVTVFSLNSSDPSTAAWTSSGAIDLSSFAGQSIQVRFVFETGDNVANNFTGWLVDDVVVTAESACTPTGCTSDAECDNGQFCDGAETCDLGSGTCQAGTPPNCNDGVGCTVDSCNETTDSCDNVPDDAACDNGLFCDGAETCHATLDCQAGTPPNCSDGVGCTVDSCNETTDSCDNTPDDAACDNGLFCDGAETCDAVNDCQAGTAPCTGGQTCNETTDVCEGGGGCLHDVDFEAGAGGWTAGANTCTTGAFVVGTPDATTWQVGGGNPGQAYFTAPNPGGIGTDDVDGGTCEALSPNVDASGQAAVSVSLDYFHGQRDQGDDATDGFRVEVLNNGSVVSTLVAIGDVTTNPAWTSVSTTVSNPGTIRVRVRATDGAGPGDIVEGGIDNVKICPTTPPPPCTVNDSFETGATGWTNGAASTCTTGAYVRGNPTLQTSGGVTTQVGGARTGTNAIFTATNTSAGVNDVDGGNCILRSPTWNVNTASTLSVWYFHGQRDNGDDPSGDFFRLQYSLNNGSTWTTFASNGDTTRNAAWTNATASIPAGSAVQLRVQASDGAGPGDIIEAGIDDLSICPQ